VHAKSGDEACADGHQDGREDNPGGVVADGGGGAAGDDGEDGYGEDEGEVANAGFGCGGALDGLEPLLEGKC